MKKGQTTSEFPTTGRTKSYLLDSVPLDLWESVKRKALSEKRSIRHIVLSLLRDWALGKAVARDELVIRQRDDQYVLQIGGCVYRLTREQFRVHCGQVIDICQGQIFRRAS